MLHCYDTAQTGILAKQGNPWPSELWRSCAPGIHGPGVHPRSGPDETVTHYGIIVHGQVTLHRAQGDYPLAAGMVFSVPGELRLTGDGMVVGITDLARRGMFQLVGPVEAEGRLRYIDGCTDSVLLSPQVRGDACLNHLHFPPHITQTFHTHPSFRAGVVLRGQGRCESTAGATPLSPGLAFFIPADVEHRFCTEGDSLDIVAFHPDSDCGPTHDDHPMVNRTMVDGISARHLPGIRT